MLGFPALLLTTLEELTEEQLKTFQSHLTSGQNTEKHNTVDQMVEKYSPGGAVSNTADQMVEKYSPGGAVSSTADQMVEKYSPGGAVSSTADQMVEKYSPGGAVSSTVDQMVEKYGPGEAVSNTVEILRRMNLDALAEQLETYHTRGIPTASSKSLVKPKPVPPLLSSSPSFLPSGSSKKLLSLTSAGSSGQLSSQQPTEKTREALLLATLEELSTDELKIFQQELTPSKELPPYLTGFPPIPETQLENIDRQVTADQMVKRNGHEEAVKITLRILNRMNREDLAEKLERYHSGGKKMRTNESPSWPGLVSRDKKSEEDCVPLTGRAPFFIKHEKNPKLEMDFSPIRERPLEMANSLNTEVAVNTQENTQRIDNSPLLDHHHMSSPDGFRPELHDQDNRREYRFQCPRAGLFQCSITGLVFRMEGEVLYRTVPWDRRLLSQSGKRPAGPLFKFTCLKGSVCQLHLPHCEIYNSGGCDFLSVAHVTDDNIEFLPPLEITETHIIINISGFSAYGDVKDEDSPTVPIRALVLLFYKPPVLPKKRSILSVLLLPRNAVIREVQEEWKIRNGDKDIYIETNSHCQLTPNQKYNLFTDLTDKYLIQPQDAEFVDFESYENYIPTFQLLMHTVVEQVNLLLKENGCVESVWDRYVWLPASPTDVTPTVSAVSSVAHPANTFTPPDRDFIKRHRFALETRLGILQPICLRLPSSWGSD